MSKKTNKTKGVLRCPAAISVDPVLWDMVLLRASALKMNRSKYIQRLIEVDLRKSGNKPIRRWPPARQLALRLR